MVEQDYSERNVYKSDSRDDLVENDEMSAEEAAFMQGYDEDDEADDEDFPESDSEKKKSEEE